MHVFSGGLLARYSCRTTLPLLFLVAGAYTANATDALPVADGAYMRSADLCEQFRKGNVDSIEFSVSKNGHYYEFPESGCVVATVKPLRTNRYAVDADCIEGGDHSQASFILDVENPQTVRIDGEQLIACEIGKRANHASLPEIAIVDPGMVDASKAATDTAALKNVPLPSFSVRSNQEQATKAESKRAAPPTKLIRQWGAANENCRGGSGDDPKTLKACGVRDTLARQLEAAKWCYGKNGQSGYQYKWHRCGKGSIHF